MKTGVETLDIHVMGNWEETLILCISFMKKYLRDMCTTRS